MTVPINRWSILGVLFIVRFALGFQFQSAGSVTPFMVDDFGVDYTGIGTLVGLYMIPGLVLALPSGFIGMSIYLVGWPIGIAAGQSVQASIAEAGSWNLVFHLTALGCAIALLALWGFYRSPPGEGNRTADTGAALNRRELALVTLAGLVWMCMNGAYLVILSFGPIFLHENGSTFATASLVVSLLSWVFLISLPVGGYLATRSRAPNRVMFAGLAGTIMVGGLILYTDMPFVSFALFGILFGVCVPIVATLPVEVLRPQTRGPGLGIYYIGYFAGSAFMPMVAGYLKDVTGTAASSLLFGIAMMAATLLLVCLFRMAQAYFPAPAESDA